MSEEQQKEIAKTEKEIEFLIKRFEYGKKVHLETKMKD